MRLKIPSSSRRRVRELVSRFHSKKAQYAILARRAGSEALSSPSRWSYSSNLGTLLYISDTHSGRGQPLSDASFIAAEGATRSDASLVTAEGAAGTDG